MNTATFTAAVTVFGIVTLEIAEAALGTITVGLARGWHGALLGASAAVVVAVGAAVVLSYAGLQLPERPLKLVAGGLLLAFGAYVLKGAVIG